MDPHPPPRQLAARPAGLSAAGLVDAEHPGRFGLGQQRLGVGDERAVRGRPRHLVDGGDLGHRAGRIPDRRADLGAQPPGSPRPGRDLIDGLGEGTAFAVVFPAPPAGLVPPHYDSILTVGNVARRGAAHLTLHRRGEHPTRRARRRRLTRGHRVHHTRPIGPALDTLDPHSWQPKQQCRTVGHGPWFPSIASMLRNFQTSEGQGPPTSTTRSMRAKSQLPA